MSLPFRHARDDAKKVSYHRGNGAKKHFESLSLKFRHARDDGKNFQGMLTGCPIRDPVEGVGADRSRVRNDLAKSTIF